MKQSRFGEAQMVGLLKEVEMGDRKLWPVARDDSGVITFFQTHMRSGVHRSRTVPNLCL